VTPEPRTNQASVTARYRRSSVRVVLETMTQDRTLAAEAHDALWAVLWSRRYDDVDEPVWQPDAAYSGILAFARPLDDTTGLAAVDIGEAFIVFRVPGPAPPIVSRVRVVAAANDQWRIAEAQPLGLGIEVRFDDPNAPADTAWIAPLREGVRRARELLDTRRERLSAHRAQLGALNEPPTVEDVWREQLAAISDRVALATDYTPQEHAALARARAKGARFADEEEHKIIAARKRRFTERGNEEIARFREGAWPELRDRVAEERRKYEDYRSEVVRLEENLQRMRAFGERVAKAVPMLDEIERTAFRVRTCAFDPARIEEPAYAEELVRSVELLHAAIPQRAQSSTTRFSAYRAPTAGPSVIPPRA
jgi:hypothetical protein